MTALEDHPVVRLLDALRKIDAEGQIDYMTSFLPHLQIVDIRQTSSSDHYVAPSITLSYTVRHEHCNQMNNLHGGAIATLFDYCTSLAVFLADKNGEEPYKENPASLLRRSGVSRTLNVTYLRPAPCGTPVLVDCEVLHAGRRMSSLRALLRRASDGAVLATCEHGKAIAASSKI